MLVVLKLLKLVDCINEPENFAGWMGREGCQMVQSVVCREALIRSAVQKILLGLFYLIIVLFLLRLA